MPEARDGSPDKGEVYTVTLTERIKDGPAERRMPNNIVPIKERRTGHRQTARWIEWSREQQAGKDLTGRAA